MKRQGNASRVLLWIAFIATCISIVFAIFSSIVLSFNVWGIADALGKMISSYGYSYDVSSEVSSLVFSFVFQALIELYFAVFYFKALKYRANSPMFARKLLFKSIWQCFVGSFVPAVFALIAATIMSKQKAVLPMESLSCANSELPGYKLEAMSEAVARLKELKDKGAISEEEYYANLNRILEG